MPPPLILKCPGSLQLKLSLFTMLNKYCSEFKLVFRYYLSRSMHRTDQLDFFLSQVCQSSLMPRRLNSAKRLFSCKIDEIDWSLLSLEQNQLHMLAKDIRCSDAVVRQLSTIRRLVKRVDIGEKRSVQVEPSMPFQAEWKTCLV